MRNVAVCGLALVAAGCVVPQPSVSSGVQDKIALCGAGMNVSLGASLEAKLADAIKNGGSLSAEIQRDLRAAFFKNADPNNENAVAAYKSYTECIDKISAG